MSIDSAKGLFPTAPAAAAAVGTQSQSKGVRPQEVEQKQQPTDTAAPAKPVERSIPTPTLEEVAARIDKYLKSVSRTLEFRVDGPSGRTVVSVRDAETGDLIRQFPNEDILRLAEMAEDQTIVLVNEKV